MTIGARIKSGKGKRPSARFAGCFFSYAAPGNPTDRDAAAPGPPPHFLGALSCRRVRSLFLLPAPGQQPFPDAIRPSPSPSPSPRRCPLSESDRSSRPLCNTRHTAHVRLAKWRQPRAHDAGAGAKRSCCGLRQVVCLLAELNDAAGPQIADECMHYLAWRWQMRRLRGPRRNAHWSS